MDDRGGEVDCADRAAAPPQTRCGEGKGVRQMMSIVTGDSAPAAAVRGREGSGIEKHLGACRASASRDASLIESARGAGCEGGGADETSRLRESGTCLQQQATPRDFLYTCPPSLQPA